MSRGSNQKDTLLVTPPKSKNTSPLSVSPAVSEIMRNHARLFGKEPLLSPLHKSPCESDEESEIGPLDSISQQGVADSESVCTDRTENFMSDSFSLLPVKTQEMRERIESPTHKTDNIDSIFDGRSSVQNNPHLDSGISQCNEMVESDSSLSPTMSQMMRNPSKIKSINRSMNGGMPDQLTIKARSKTNGTVTLYRGIKKFLSASSAILSPIRSELNKLHIYDTPQKKQRPRNTDIIDVGDDITKNRHEISPLIQEHLSAKHLPNNRKSRAVRNIFRSPKYPKKTRTRRISSSGKVLNITNLNTSTLSYFMLFRLQGVGNP